MRLTGKTVRCAACGVRPAAITWTVHVDCRELALPLCGPCAEQIERGLDAGTVRGCIDIPASADRPARYWLCPNGESRLCVELNPSKHI